MKELHEIYWLDIKKVEETNKNDAKAPNKYIISGPFTRVDIPNRNNRIYPKEVANAAIAKLRPMVEEKRIRMLCDHPGFFEGPSLERSAGLLLSITDVQDDGYAYYTAQILDTDSGRNLKAILDAGSKIGVSTRGTGESEDYEWVDSNGDKRTVEKINNWELQSVDFVDDPAVLDTEMYMKLHMESLQRRTSSMAKNVEELKSEYPEFCKQIAESACADVKKEFETKITDLEANVKTANESVNAKSEALDKLVDSVKAMAPDKFTIVQESEAIQAKDAEIAELNKKLEEANSKIESLENEIKETKIESEKKEKDAFVENLKVSDPEFFKLDSFKNIFDNCITKEDVKTVYENNSKIVKEMKEKSIIPSAGKTLQTDESADQKDNELIEGLTPVQYEDFKSRNEMRRLSNLDPMTTEKYLAMFGASAK